MYTPTKVLIPPRPPSSGGDSSGDWRKRALAVIEEESLPLQDTFAHTRNNYHGTQHDALNAELRYKVEGIDKGWSEVIDMAAGYIGRTASRADPTADILVDALNKYESGYHFTLQPPVSEEDVCKQCNLTMSAETVAEVLGWPSIDEAGIHRTFVELQSAEVSLPTEDLIAARTTLAVLDTLSRKPMSDCSVAMHDEHHIDVTTALREELAQGGEYLHTLERKVGYTSEIRAESYQTGDYQRCHECFQEEISIGDDLVKLSAQRMDLFEDAESDVAKYAADVSDLISAAQGMADGFKARLDALNSAVAGYISTLSDSIADAQVREERVVAEGRASYAQHREGIDALNVKEKQLWSEIMERMGQLQTLAGEKHTAVEACMGAVEKASAARQGIVEQQKAYDAFMDRLRRVATATMRARFAEEEFRRYTEAMTPMLLTDCDELAEAVLELKIAETTSTLTRYDRLADTVEECRQRTRNRIDGIERADRQRQLSLETVKDSYDPNTAKYEQDALRSEYIHASLTEFFDKLSAVSKEARDRVEGTLLFALQVLHEAPINAKVLAGDVGLADTGALRVRPGSPKRHHNAVVTPISVATIDVTTHPQLAAAVKALALEDFQVGSAEDYVSAVQTVIEERRAQLQAAIRRMLEVQHVAENGVEA